VLGLPLAFILSQDQTLHCIEKFNHVKIYCLPEFSSGDICLLGLLQYFQRTCSLFHLSLSLYPNGAAKVVKDF
ncbi:MAG: hypothetical protein WCO63_15635, partial [Bacteroidota bacterium]